MWRIQFFLLCLLSWAFLYHSKSISPELSFLIAVFSFVILSKIFAILIDNYFLNFKKDIFSSDTPIGNEKEQEYSIKDSLSEKRENLPNLKGSQNGYNNIDRY